MQLCLFGNRLAFQNLFHEIDTPARTVQFIAQQLIGGACSKAETAMNAIPQYLLRFLAFRGILDEIGEIGLHGYIWGYIRPGLNNPLGSNFSFRRRVIVIMPGVNG